MAAVIRPPQKARPAPLPDALAYTIPDACRVSGIGRTKLYELIKAGRLGVCRAAGRVLVLGDSLRALLNTDQQENQMHSPRASRAGPVSVGAKANHAGSDTNAAPGGRGTSMNSRKVASTTV
jgi:hypothetical protein